MKKALGVDLIEIEQVALSELATRRRNTDPKVWDLLVNWTQTDDSYYIFVAFDGFNTSLLHDTKYYTKAAQEWIDKGNSLPNGPDRNIAYQNAQKADPQGHPARAAGGHPGHLGQPDQHRRRGDHPVRLLQAEQRRRKTCRKSRSIAYDVVDSPAAEGQGPSPAVWLLRRFRQ